MSQVDLKTIALCEIPIFIKSLFFQRKNNDFEWSGAASWEPKSTKQQAKGKKTRLETAWSVLSEFQSLKKCRGGGREEQVQGQVRSSGSSWRRLGAVLETPWRRPVSDKRLKSEPSWLKNRCFVRNFLSSQKAYFSYGKTMIASGRGLQVGSPNRPNSNPKEKKHVLRRLGAS